MPYFHVLVSLEGAPERQRCILRDLGEKELVASFVGKYKAGKDLLCDGEVVPVRSIRRISIISTVEAMSQALADLDAKSEAHRQELNRGPGGLVFLGGGGYGPGDIAEAGEDVTAKFITDAPASTLQPGVVARVLSNGWVVGIGGTVVAAGITAWLKWN